MKKQKKSPVKVKVKKLTPKQRRIRNREQHIQRLIKRKADLFRWYVEDVKKLEARITYYQILLRAVKAGKI